MRQDHSSEVAYSLMRETEMLNSFKVKGVITHMCTIITMTVADLEHLTVCSALCKLFCMYISQNCEKTSLVIITFKLCNNPFDRCGNGDAKRLSGTLTPEASDS